MGECTKCSPSGKPLGLQACPHPSKGKRKVRAMREKEREREAPKAKEVSIKCHKFLLSLESGQGVA